MFAGFSNFALFIFFCVVHIMDIECTWILGQGENCSAIMELIGQFVHLVGGEGMR